MNYQMPVFFDEHKGAGRRLDAAEIVIPIVYRSQHLPTSAHFHEGKYVYSLEGELEQKLNNRLLHVGFGYEEWKETDAGRPNCRIVAIVLKDIGEPS